MENKSSNLEQLMADVERYVNLRLTDFKLRTVDGISALFSLVLTILACICLLNLALIFIFGGITLWLSTWIGSLPWAMLITGGIFLLMVLLLLACRHRLITDRFVSVLIKMLFDEKVKDNDDEEEEL